MEYTLLSILLINVIVLIGSLLQGLIGYGVGMFCAPLLFLISPTLVPAPLILISTIITVVMMMRDREHLQFKQVSWAMTGGFFGVLAAGLVLKVTSKEQFELVFALLILFAVFISILGFIPKVNNKTNTIAGFTSGLMGTITAVGGPPMALLYQHGDIKNIKANLTAFFLFLNIVALSTLALVGQITSNTFIAVAIALPGIAIGFYISSKAHHIIKPHLIRKWILTLSAITAIIALVRAVS
ncbi:sulfite exporter TauE/SafE family protein [Colwellia sp. E2M01]|uniref:sulfite exporter TauE/SafE family protein n=1 Tax=Colwellia sp. E2M01 TaxID=2841561 RepID=UPI001C099DA9|nr:sulfite exporter TauE/SafE family protein [Colwellia sp. E2M01]MBU2872172.1 sulfite exporter TauE/SafE family protein [Colwellia sp. E2M01]